MDILVLMLVVKLANINTTFFRIFASAGIGAIWICIIMIFNINRHLEMFFSYIVIVFVMVKIVAYTCKFKKIIKMMILQYVVTFTIGGMAHFLYYYTYAGYIIGTLISSTKGLVLVSLITVGIFVSLKGLIRQYVVYGKKVYDVLIVKGDIKINVKALYDSGNTLNDPLFNKPVNIIERNKLQRIIEKNADITSLRYRIIPYNSLGNPNGIITVVDVDYICIYKENEEIIINEAALAIYDKALSKSAAYSMLLNSMIFENKEK